jgi:hypothetical protein
MWCRWAQVRSCSVRVRRRRFRSVAPSGRMTAWMLAPNRWCLPEYQASIGSRRQRLRAPRRHGRTPRARCPGGSARRARRCAGRRAGLVGRRCGGRDRAGRSGRRGPPPPPQPDVTASAAVAATVTTSRGPILVMAPPVTDPRRTHGSDSTTPRSWSRPAGPVVPAPWHIVSTGLTRYSTRVLWDNVVPFARLGDPPFVRLRSRRPGRAAVEGLGPRAGWQQVPGFQIQGWSSATTTTSALWWSASCSPIQMKHCRIRLQQESRRRVSAARRRQARMATRR